MCKSNVNAAPLVEFMTSAMVSCMQAACIFHALAGKYDILPLATKDCRHFEGYVERRMGRGDKIHREVLLRELLLKGQELLHIAPSVRVN